MSDRRKHRILCLSRSTTHLKQILTHISDGEFEVIPSSSPEEAVALCTANQVNAIVLDSEFVTERGWTVAQSFRMVAPHLPIVLVKANHHHEAPVGIDAVAAGADLVLGTLKKLLANGNSNTRDGASSRPRLPFERKLKAVSAENETSEDDGKARGSQKKPTSKNHYESMATSFDRRASD